MDCNSKVVAQRKSEGVELAPFCNGNESIDESINDATDTDTDSQNHKPQTTTTTQWFPPSRAIYERGLLAGGWEFAPLLIFSQRGFEVVPTGMIHYTTVSPHHTVHHCELWTHGLIIFWNAPKAGVFQKGTGERCHPASSNQCLSSFCILGCLEGLDPITVNNTLSTQVGCHRQKHSSRRPARRAARGVAGGGVPQFSFIWVDSIRFDSILPRECIQIPDESEGGESIQTTHKTLPPNGAP